MRIPTNWEIIYLLTEKRLLPKQIVKLGYPMTAYKYAKRLEDASRDAERNYMDNFEKIIPKKKNLKG